MRKQPVNLEYLATVSPAKIQLYLLAAGVSLSLQECSKLQSVLKDHFSCIQGLPHLFNETEQVLGKKRTKELILKAASFL